MKSADGCLAKAECVDLTPRLETVTDLRKCRELTLELSELSNYESSRDRIK